MSEPLYLLDTNVLLFLARGGALGQHIGPRLAGSPRRCPQHG